ncbi:heterocyst frequency control protein PatD [Cyanobacterium sp. Dongsha4]|uniref:heterocyst frequency control protein PatD n=1 Tax=Cyanobacterium sp. DS4 TaxID=2878255 RepID=UPI002E811EB6|nr:heterocyst frequency control protein PatD [Cyanobacterium sp. Dongsha4]WVL01705.1 heterocyst frequency control protein PatD [Cyanobacterium sp. Dongsha4]
MLPKSHFSLLSDWLNLLVEFQQIFTSNSDDIDQIFSQWQKIQNYLQTEIMTFEENNIDISVFSQWQSWQRETHRYGKLINTELLFWKSSVSPSTKQQRKESILQHLQGMIQLTINNQ